MATSYKRTYNGGSDFDEFSEQFELWVSLKEDHIEVLPVRENFATDELFNAQTSLYNACELKKRKQFLTALEPSVYADMKNVVYPRQLVQIPYTELKQLVRDHFCPKPTVPTERFTFSRMKQGNNESVQAYVSRLKSCAQRSNFTGNVFNTRCLEQFISGLFCDDFRDMLLAEDWETLTFITAVEKIVTKERSKRETQIVGKDAVTPSTSGAAGVNRVNKWRKPAGDYSGKQQGKGKKPGKPKSNIICNKCKLPGHIFKDCKTRCFKCKSMGHIKKNCVNHVQQVDHVDTDFDNDSNIANWEPNSIHLVDSINRVDSNSKPRVSVKLDLGDVRKSVNVSMEFDTGSSVALCSERWFVQSGLSCVLSPHHQLLKVANGQSEEAKGKATVNVTFKGKRIPGLDLVIVKGNFPALFGWNWITAFLGKSWLKEILERFNADGKSSLCQYVVREVESVGLDRESVLQDRVSVECGSEVLHGETMDESVSLDRKSVLLSQERVSVKCDSVLSHGETEQPDVLCSVSEKSVVRVKDPSEDAKGVKDFGRNTKGDQRLDVRLIEDKERRAKTKNQPAATVLFRTLDQLKQSEVFTSGLGLVEGFKAQLRIKDDATPISLKARMLPFAIKEKVKEELQRMVEDGILKSVESSEWATPIVVVTTKQKIRICGDYKSTVNKCLAVKQYPIPSLEECLHAVRGGVVFTVVDIAKAYNNLELREADKTLTTLNTPFGLYRWNRLPYGVSSSGAIFQEVVDEALKGIPMTACRIDDIIVSGRTKQEHLENLNRVIQILEKKGFKCNREKSQFEKEQVVYLGHVISKDGIRTVQSKVKDLQASKVPTNTEELVSFLGAVNYYRRFLPDLSTVVAPLDRLRSKDVSWKWTKTEQKSFGKLIEMLGSDRVLTYYQPELELKLDTDASSVGLGAVLSHVLPSGEERPIEYASRTLSLAERNYAQIDREALAIVWGIKKFNIYLYGRKFKLITDHRPLTYIFGKNRLPQMASSRVNRWSLFLSEYDYTIEYRSTKQHANCDFLSRLPCSTSVKTSEVQDDLAEIFAVTLEDAYIDAELIARETRKDLVLSKVFGYIHEGWPSNLKAEGDMQAFWNRRDELALELNCITWGTRVVIPSQLRGHVMKILHSTHIGMCGMKSIARSYVYWPRIDADIENTCKTCDSCGKYGNSKPRVADHPWNRPTGPWQRVHVDYAGPFMNSMWLVLQDAYSKWPEVIRMNSSTAHATVKALHTIFSRTGYPCVLVSDNGTHFKNQEMSEFTEKHRIKHLFIPIYSPKTNGIVERFNGTFKKALKKMRETNRDLDECLAEFLISYRNCPHTVTNTPPAVLMYGRTLRSNLHALKPSDQQKLKSLHPDKEQKLLNEKRREFVDNQDVWIQATNDKTWEKAKILQRVGTSNVYDVVYRNRVIQKHADSIKERVKDVLRRSTTGPDNDHQVRVVPFVPVVEPVLPEIGGPVVSPFVVSTPESVITSEPVFREPDILTDSLPSRSSNISNRENLNSTPVNVANQNVTDDIIPLRVSLRSKPKVDYKLLAGFKKTA